MSYLSWRMTFQDAEQAARTAYRSWEECLNRCYVLEAKLERLRHGESEEEPAFSAGSIGLDSEENIQSSIT